MSFRANSVRDLLELTTHIASKNNGHAIEIAKDFDPETAEKQLANFLSEPINKKLAIAGRSLTSIVSPAPKPQLESRLKAGQPMVATGWERGNPRGKRIWFGYLVEVKNNIVTLKLTNGKTVYLFNSVNYKWEVKPVTKFPTFSLPHK